MEGKKKALPFTPGHALESTSDVTADGGMTDGPNLGDM